MRRNQIFVIAPVTISCFHQALHKTHIKKYLDKVSYVEKSGIVIYRFRMTHGRNKKNYKLFSAIEFIAAITQHIPEKSFQLVRYYGWYSNRARGDRLKCEKALQEKANSETVNLPEIIDISNYRPKRIPSPAWRECIKKIWEVDPLEYPRCQAEMKIISFIHEPDVIKKILKHLHLWEPTAQPRPPTNSILPHTTVVYEPVDDGWPGYEEPYINA